MSAPRSQRAFAFWTRFLLVASALFAAQAASWIVIGSFDPFGLYKGLLAHALFGGDGLSPEARTTFRFGVGLLGATTAAFFVLVFLIVRHAFSRREPWSHRAVVAGVAVWFVLDSGFSLAVGAVFNVVLVNVPCLIILAIPLLATAREFARAEGR